MLITASIAIVSYASRFFDWGVRLLDWAQRVDFLRLRQARILSILQWLVSPTGADIIFIVAVIIFFLAVILAVNPKDKPEINSVVTQGAVPSLPNPMPEIGRLSGEVSELRLMLNDSQRDQQTLHVEMRGKKQQMKEVQRERDRYKTESQGWKDQYDEEHQAAIRLKTLNDQYDEQIRKLTSDAEEARREKLLADDNLRGVESDRNNYRTWYNELAWLNPAIKPQKEDISNYITVIAARPCVLSLKERRVVVIDLVIRNDSFFDIRIKPGTVAGQLSTNKKGLLHDPAKAFVDLNHPPIENLKPTEEKMFAIIQPLLRTEAEEIEDAIAQGSDGYFWLGTLNIPISVQNAEPLEVDSKPLRMNSNVEHVYFREFGSLTNDGEVITPQELVRSIDALPFPERARIYRELSKTYDESLWRLNQAKENKDPEVLANEAV